MALLLGHVLTDRCQDLSEDLRICLDSLCQSLVCHVALRIGVVCRLCWSQNHVCTRKDSRHEGGAQFPRPEDVRLNQGPSMGRGGKAAGSVENSFHKS